MILIGNYGIFFKSKNFYHILNDKFNVILFTDNTVFFNNQTYPLGFIIPIDYLSFIKVIDEKFDLETNLKDIFKFDNLSDEKNLSKYIKKINYKKKKVKNYKLIFKTKN